MRKRLVCRMCPCRHSHVFRTIDARGTAEKWNHLIRLNCCRHGAANIYLHHFFSRSLFLLYFVLLVCYVRVDMKEGMIILSILEMLCRAMYRVVAVARHTSVINFIINMCARIQYEGNVRSHKQLNPDQCDWVISPVWKRDRFPH